MYRYSTPTYHAYKCAQHPQREGGVEQVNLVDYLKSLDDVTGMRVGLGELSQNSLRVRGVHLFLQVDRQLLCLFSHVFPGCSIFFKFILRIFLLICE